MKTKKTKTSKIQIEVTLDDKQMPVEIKWHAQDSASKDFKPVKCLFISMFDEAADDTMKLDLWTKEFRVDEMDMFMFQTLRSMADSYYKATNNSDLANRMVQFAHYFGEQTEILKPEDPEDQPG